MHDLDVFLTFSVCLLDKDTKNLQGKQRTYKWMFRYFVVDVRKILTRPTQKLIFMEAEKIICCDKGNDNALAYAAMANKQDPMAMAAMMNGGLGGNQWLNNPFLYLIFLAMFGGNGFGFGGNRNGLQDAEIQNQIQSLRSQMADNHNSDLLMQAIKGNNDALTTLGANLNCDFNQLQQGVCSVRSAIDNVAGQVGFSAERVINAAEKGNAQVIQAIQNCCCNTQQSILKMGYENQLAVQGQTNALQQGLNFVNSSVERGFSALGFQNAQDKCDIIRASQDNTQRIVDTLNQHWYADIERRYQDARLELSQRNQTAALISALGTKTTATT